MSTLEKFLIDTWQLNTIIHCWIYPLFFTSSRPGEHTAILMRMATMQCYQVLHVYFKLLPQPGFLPSCPQFYSYCSLNIQYATWRLYTQNKGGCSDWVNEERTRRSCVWGGRPCQYSISRCWVTFSYHRHTPWCYTIQSSQMLWRCFIRKVVEQHY